MLLLVVCGCTILLLVSVLNVLRSTLSFAYARQRASQFSAISFSGFSTRRVVNFRGAVTLLQLFSSFLLYAVSLSMDLTKKFDLLCGIVIFSPAVADTMALVFLVMTSIVVSYTLFWPMTIILLFHPGLI